jgi:hypothetical protein
MSVIEAIKTYLKTYTGLETGAPVWVDYLGPAPTGYAIISLAGTKTVDTDILGNKTQEFPFAFQSMESTADELARLENSGFYEAFSDWLESQTEAGSLPTLGTKKTAESIEAVGWGYLYEQGESTTGIYQIMCKLTYQQQP